MTKSKLESDLSKSHVPEAATHIFFMSATGDQSLFAGLVLWLHMKYQVSIKY